MLSGTSAGVFNISHVFQVFWSETGSAMEYGEDFARMIQVSVQNLADLWQSLIPFAPLNLVEVAHVTH